MERFPLPVWLKEGPQVTKLATAFSDYWDKVEDWLQTPLQQTNAETCHVAILKMMAYQRDVERFANEPDELFRKRVEFAVKNAQDAGSVAGFKEIFERFDVPLYGQIERDPEKDWDVITLWLGDSAITQNPELGQYIVRQYGRTCRRYEFLLVDALEPIGVTAVPLELDRQLSKAASVPEWIFKDVVDSARIEMVGAEVDQTTSRLMQPVIAFEDQVLGFDVALTCGGVTRSVDTIRGNE